MTVRAFLQNRLEPISKLPEEDNETGELNEAEEVLRMVFPTDKNASLPLDPSEEAFDEPAPRVSTEPAAILRGWLDSVRAVRGDHLDALSAQFVVERIAVIGAIADEVLRLGLDHVEVEA